MSSVVFLSMMFLIKGCSSTSLLLQLLKTPVSDAMCRAKCQDVPTDISRAQCYQVCKYRQNNPSSDICRVPDLCVDFGCQVACQDIPDPSRALFDGFSRSQCQVSWSLSSDSAGARSNVVFVLSAQDHSGMWSLLQDNVSDDQYSLDPTFGHKYHTLAILAVNRERVLDVLLVKVPLHLQCPDQEQTSSSGTIVTGVDDSEFLAVLCLSLLVLVLMIILSLIICCRRTRNMSKSNSFRYLTKQRDSPVMKTKIDGKTKKYEDCAQSRHIRVENTYVPGPWDSTQDSFYENP